MADSEKDVRFKAIVLPHLHAAFNLACWLTRNRQAAEDVAQEACLRAFKYFDSLRGEDARCWLLAIVRNTFRDRYRETQEERQSLLFDDELHGGEEPGSGVAMHAATDPETLLMYKDSERRLRQAMAGLPLEFREVLVLREMDELSYKQISDVVGIPMGTVMSRLGRGRKLLAKILAGDNPEA